MWLQCERRAPNYEALPCPRGGLSHGTRDFYFFLFHQLTCILAIFALFGGVFLEDDSVGRLLLLLDGENREPLSPCHKPTTPCPACGITRDFFYFYFLSLFIAKLPCWFHYSISNWSMGDTAISFRLSKLTPRYHYPLQLDPLFFVKLLLPSLLTELFFLFRKKSFFSGKRNFLLGFFNMNCCPDNPIAVACPDPFVKGD